MRRVFTSVVGSCTKFCAVWRAPLFDGEPRRTAERGDVMNTSCPSRKNRRLSGKKVSNAVRFTTTSSDSTAPKSGYAVAVIWKLDDGRQNRSNPARSSGSFATSSQLQLA